MKKYKLFSLILALILIISAMPISVNAVDYDWYGLEDNVITHLDYPGVKTFGSIDIIERSEYVNPYTNETSINYYLKENINLIDRDTEIVIADLNNKNEVDIRWCIELHPYHINSEGMVEAIKSDVYRLQNGKLVKLKYEDAWPDDGDPLTAAIEYDDSYDKIHTGETVRFHLPFDDYDEPVLFEFSYEMIYNRYSFIEKYGVEENVYSHRSLYAGDVAIKDIANIPSKKDYSFELSMADKGGYIVNGEHTFDSGYGYHVNVTNHSEYYNLDTYFALIAIPKSSSDHYDLGQISYFHAHVIRKSSKGLFMDSNFGQLSSGKYNIYLVDFDDLEDMKDFANILQYNGRGDGTIETDLDLSFANSGYQNDSTAPYMIKKSIDSNVAFLKSIGIEV